MSVIKTLVFVGVSLYLAFIFGMAGANKLYPVDPATHKYLVDACKHWPGVFAPIFGTALPDGDTLRIILGASEVLGAIAIALSPWVLPKSLGSLASLGLIAIMGGAIYLHHAFNDAVTFPAMLAALCVLRLIVTPASRAAKKMKSQ